MQKQPNRIIDIAKMAGVSPAAVSAVINNRRGTVRLSEATRQRIEDVLHKFRYQPNAVGKGLVVGKSFLIGVVVGDVSKSFIPQAIQGIEDIVAAKGYGPLLMTSRQDLDREHQILQFMQQRRVDGIIISPIGPNVDLETMRLLRSMQIPTIFLFYQFQSSRSSEQFVCVDSEQVSFLAIGHLLQRGHRHVACVGLHSRNSIGVSKAVKACSENVEIETWSFTFGENTAEDVLARWCMAKNRPAALFVPAGDELACDILHLAVRKGVQIPQDLAIVGVDDIPIAAKAVIPLTTIYQPKYEQGVCAVKKLFDMIEGRDADSQVLRPELIIRQST
jgi:DNA-binding LacI/PurR family transcriptional regulator